MSVIPVDNTKTSVKHRDNSEYIFARGQYWHKQHDKARGILVLTSCKTGEVKVVAMTY